MLRKLQTMQFSLPSQVFLSDPSLNPTLQLHVKLPNVLLQCWLHPEVFSAHSSTSEKMLFWVIQWSVYSRRGLLTIYIGKRIRQRFVQMVSKNACGKFRWDWYITIYLENKHVVTRTPSIMSCLRQSFNWFDNFLHVLCDKFLDE